MKFGRLIGDAVETSARQAIALPTASGILFFALVVVLLLGAINFQSNLGFVMAFALLVFGFIALVFLGFNFHQVSLALANDVYCEEGQEPELTVSVQSKSPSQKIQLGIEDRTVVCDVEPNSQCIQMRCNPRIRGVSPMPSIEIGSTFPFGWAFLRCRWQTSKQLIIYPRPIKSIEQHQQSRPDGRDQIHVRDYRPGDRMASIAWKKTRRLESPVVIDIEGASRPFNFSYRDFDAVDFETALSYLTWDILRCAEQGDSWSLELPRVMLSTGNGSDHLEQSLRMLADA
ncbi:DUF58 domain-containing protein [Litoricolaceae bacterium]|nr:DUF58 domain-containing protein [Litorivicinaceae bacterium]